MIERFSDGTRRVLAVAQEESRFLGHQRCGSEHLFLALLRDPGVAGQRLAAQGIPLDAARRAVVEVQGRYPLTRAVDGETLPFSPNAKAALSNAIDAADEGGKDAVNTDFLLSGLLKANSETLSAVLMAIPGVTAPTLRDPS
ncbi:MAG: Clp protease N-terminal domain-containing protein [Acidimicrobiales bacterium]